MEDLFGFGAPQNNSQDPFGFDNSNPSATNVDPFNTSQPVSNNILDDIFGTGKSSQQNVNTNSMPSFVKPKKEVTQPSNTTGSAISHDPIWDLIENPNPNNDVTQLFNNVSNTTKDRNKNGKKSKSNLRDGKNGMLTKKIKQIAKISPAAKWFIAAYFKHECSSPDDIIIPESVEILGLMYLGHPAFVHCYIADNKYAQPLESTHKLFIVFGYHTLNDLIDEYLSCSRIISAIESQENAEKQKRKKNNFNNTVQTDFALNELFTEKINEKEHRIWRREIKPPRPAYNGSYKERIIFDHIDDLFLKDSSQNIMSDNKAPIYNDWDEFLGIDEAKKEKKTIVDDWKCVDESMKSLFDRNGLCEMEILIEQKDILGDWIRDYEECQDPVVEFSYLNGLGIGQMAFCTKDDIREEKILSLTDWK